MEEQEIRNINGSLLLITYYNNNGDILTVIDKIHNKTKEIISNPILTGCYESIETAKTEVEDFLAYNFGKDIALNKNKTNCCSSFCKIN